LVALGAAVCLHRSSGQNQAVTVAARPAKRDSHEVLAASGDAVAEVLVDGRDARRGVVRTVGWPETEPCDACEGGGGAPEAISMACPACESTGRRVVDGSLSEGGALELDACPTCGGRGRLVSERCPGCDGAGVRRVWQAAEVRVPAGAADGLRLPLYEGSREVVVVRVVEARSPDSQFVRYVAVLALLVALVFLWLLLR
jgi:DnaJ-class molecular chaperone